MIPLAPKLIIYVFNRQRRSLESPVPRKRWVTTDVLFIAIGGASRKITFGDMKG